MIRLLLTLLLVAVALPAAARPACHVPAGQTLTMQHGGHRPSQHAPLMAEHVCIGCIPSVGNDARIAGPILAPTVPAVLAIARLDLGGGAPPALPPPRLG